MSTHRDALETDGQRLQRLLRARPGCVRIVTPEEDYALDLLRDAAMALGRDMWLWSCVHGVREALLAQSKAIADTTELPKALAFLAGAGRDPLCVLLDAGAHLGQPRVLRALRDTLPRLEAAEKVVVLLEHSVDLPAIVRSVSTPFDLSLPDEVELEKLVRGALRREHRERTIQVDLTRNQLDLLVRNLRGLTRRQAEQLVREAVAEDRQLDESDVHGILAGKRRMLSDEGLLEFIETPADLAEIGGLARLKSWLAQREGALSQAAAKFGLVAPRGVLMLGVQGAGKSLCAKAIAAAWQRPLLRMDVGALYDRYVGESERRLRDALQQAERMAPLVLWIDEIEKAFASAAAQSTDGGLSKRMFGCLLTWMQEHQAPVFLVATANDIEALPPELLRKGRFDEIFFCDLPTAAVRREILEIHLRKRRRDPASFDLEQVAAAADGFSGAELEQAVVAGLHAAFAAGGELTTQRLLDAIAGSPPLAVTMAERVDRLRRWAAGRCVAAD